MALEAFHTRLLSNASALPPEEATLRRWGDAYEEAMRAMAKEQAEMEEAEAAARKEIEEAEEAEVRDGDRENGREGRLLSSASTG